MRINPFLETLEIPVHRVRKRDVPDWKEELNENEYFEVESIHFLRVYRGPDKANKLDVLLTLSPSTLRLYTWIQYYIPRDSDEIKIDDRGISGLLDISDRQAQKARLELIDKAIICKKQDNIYWVNPRYICSGNRIKMYPKNKHVISKNTEEEYNQPNMYDILSGQI